FLCHFNSIGTTLSGASVPVVKFGLGSVFRSSSSTTFSTNTSSFTKHITGRLLVHPNSTTHLIHYRSLIGSPNSTK
ncbi:hypothetical protein GIB67_015087, partial [Kingdonia uniflora]